MRGYKYIVNEIPPSLNKYLGNSHSYQIYRQDKDHWEWLVRLAIKNDRPQKPFEKAEVIITYFFGNRRRHDSDNYSGKFINDGLVKAGVLKDDSFKCMDLKVKGDTDLNNPRTEIFVRELVDVIKVDKRKKKRKRANESILDTLYTCITAGLLDEILILARNKEGNAEMIGNLVTKEKAIKLLEDILNNQESLKKVID